MEHILLDPGHGGTLGKDNFRQGPGGEREEWINLSVAKQLKPILEAKGYVVSLTRRKDVATSLQTRLDLAVNSKADLLVSIHHASCEPAIREINFPFFYINKSTQKPHRQDFLVKCFLDGFSKLTHGPGIGYIDQWVFNDGLFILRECEKNGIASILTEFSFFSHVDEEKKLKTKDYCRYEAEVLASCIDSYFIKTKTAKGLQASASTLSDFPVAYSQQLKSIKSSLLDSNKVNWSAIYSQSELLFNRDEFQQAVTLFEQALALNPYHPKIEEQLNKMYICTGKINALEYQKNISLLLDSIYT